MSRTLGEAMDQTFDELEQRDPEAAVAFRAEYNTDYSHHNTGWRNQPETLQTGIFPQLLSRMQQVLEQLSS